MMAMLFAETGKPWARSGFFLFVGGGSVWSAFCQVKFEFSLHHSNGYVGWEAGDTNLQLRER